jgi:hypothetical protein
VRRSIRERATSAGAARWTNAPSAAAGPEADNSEVEFHGYCRNRLAEGKLPLCPEICATKAHGLAEALLAHPLNPGASLWLLQEPGKGRWLSENGRRSLYSQAPWS